MRNKLISYIDLLFAGNPGTEDIKQEILQNTLDRYDDLVAEGKSPEAAYSLAISGIGDISEIIGGATASGATDSRTSGSFAEDKNEEKKRSMSKLFRAIAVALYILCPVPLFVLQNEKGLCLLLLIVAIATALMVISNSQKRKERNVYFDYMTPQQKLRKSIQSAISTAGLVIYFVISFATGAWFITWLVFPIVGAINGIVGACMDLREEKNNEK